MTSPDDLPVAGTAVLLRDAAPGLEVLLMRRPDTGSFGGAWVFPGGRVEPEDRVAGDDEVDDARRAAIRETSEEVGLVAEELVVLSRWQPPAEAPVRIRTWFFVGTAEQGLLRLSSGEVVDARWSAPADALARHGAGEWTLFPPTWVTLHGLCRFGSVAEAVAAAGIARHFSTRVTTTATGRAFAWDGLRLEAGALPWRLVED